MGTAASTDTPRADKHPTEAFAVAFKYQSDDLPGSSIIASSIASAVKDSDLSDASFGVGDDVLDSGTGTVSEVGTKVAIGVQNGVTGETYTVTLVHTLDTSEEFVDQFILVVDDGSRC